MKKLLLFLLPIFVLVSCKEDEPVPTPEPEPAPDNEVSHMLQGNWINNFVVREYYGDGDTIVYADSVETQAFFEFKGNKMIISLPNNPSKEEWTYNMPDATSPEYVTFTKGSEKTDYMVLSISDTAMVWLDEQAWAGYPIDVPDTEKKTSKVGMFTYRFVRAE